MNEEKFNDETIMFFGKYAGVKLANVPDDYLLWYWSLNVDDYKAGLLVEDKLKLMVYIDNFLPEIRK